MACSKDSLQGRQVHRHEQLEVVSCSTALASCPDQQMKQQLSHSAHRGGHGTFSAGHGTFSAGQHN